jgi:hypothetical protein
MLAWSELSYLLYSHAVTLNTQDHWLLTETQLKTIPQLRVEHARETGCTISGDSPVTGLFESDALKSAIARFGSVEGLEQEIAVRIEKAQATYDAKIAATRAQGLSIYAVKAPKILSVQHVTNYVGINQQRSGTVGGSKYGHLYLY